MNNKKFLLVIIITLIAGLLLGFFGGYQYKDLNAGAPPSNTGSSNNVSLSWSRSVDSLSFPSGTDDESAKMGDMTMHILGMAIIESFQEMGSGSAVKGMEIFSQEGAVSNNSISLTDKLASSATILNQGSNALAAGDDIVKEAGDFVKNGIKSIGNWISGRRDIPRCSKLNDVKASQCLATMVSKSKEYIQEFIAENLRQNICIVRIDANLFITIIVAKNKNDDYFVKYSLLKTKPFDSRVTARIYDKTDLEGNNWGYFDTTIKYDKTAGILVPRNGTVQYDLSANIPKGFSAICKEENMEITATGGVADDKFNTQACKTRGGYNQGGGGSGGN
jgi:hypothetical protein